MRRLSSILLTVACCLFISTVHAVTFGPKYCPVAITAAPATMTIHTAPASVAWRSVNDVALLTSHEDGIGGNISPVGSSAPTTLSRWKSTPEPNYEPSARVILCGDNGGLAGTQNYVGNGELTPVGDVIPAMLTFAILYTLYRVGLRKKKDRR